MKLSRLLTPISWLVAAVLLFFTFKRWLFTWIALLPDKNGSKFVDSEAMLPSVLLLVPVRNEAEALPGLCESLGGLRYPNDKLTVVFVNDGSTDDSELILQSWTQPYPNWHVLTLSQNSGKANALNHALSVFQQGDVIAIYDADERPQPNALVQLLRPFADSQVGAVSGRRAVSNSLSSPAAAYTTFEGLVHQLITMRAKDRLNLAPAILGANCAYRRKTLAEVGNFKPGALLEDSDLTLKLVRAGWRLHFEPNAVSYHHVPETVAGYWKQHTRWARGFNEVAKEHTGSLLGDRHLSWPLRMELLTFSLGYLDRLALLVGSGLVLLGQRFVAWVIALSLITPLLQTLAALNIANASAALRRQIIWMPAFFIIDLAMAAVGFWGTLRRAPQIWENRQERK